MSGLATPAAFDVLGPLPTGTTLLEAAAGTGKTWTIAALVTRFVAEGAADLRGALLVTFGRAATRELRERVRERLTQARDALAPEARATAPGHPDPVVAFLAAAPAIEVEARYRRLLAATADLDAATVVTTHRFCQLVIQGLGSAASADPGTQLVEDIGDLVTDVAADLYLRKWAAIGDPAFSWEIARKIARTAAGDTHAELTPRPAQFDGVADTRARFAERVRAEVATRLRAHRAMSFDDLLRELRDVLVDTETGEVVAAQMRGRYGLVLVDEFQDTDPVQWEILRRAFHGHCTLVLIGDPKQAIYAFRGGDVQSYLDAAGHAASRATLARNFRSDPRLLDGLAALFAGATLGHDLIRVAPVQPGRSETLLRSTRPPVQVRLMPSEKLPTDRYGVPKAPDARRAVVADLANEIVRRLQSGELLAAEPGAEPKPIAPGDLAVLVRANSQAEQVRDALIAAGVPAVLRATTNVFGTAAARDWAVLLEAIEQPHWTARIRRLALSCFVGHDAAALDTGGDRDTERLAEQVRLWSTLLADCGVAALFAAVDTTHRTTARLLAERGGERQLTDLRHIADVLHQAAAAEGLGPAALLTWLRRRMVEAERSEPGAERSRRLDSDAAAVQVVTVHTSKGLEFPLVYLPFAWNRYVEPPEVALYHDADGRRCRDVGGTSGPDWSSVLRAHRREDAGEDLRLLYVAATRARSALTVWWCRSTVTAESALHRLVFTPVGAPIPTDAVLVPDDATAQKTLRERFADAPSVEVLAAESGPPLHWTAPAAAGESLSAATFARVLETGWRRTSYSGLTALAHDRAGHPPALPPEADVEEAGTVDEPDGADHPPVAGPIDSAPAPAFALLPGGAAFGSLVHEVLEHVDPAGSEADVLAACVEELRRAPIADLEASALASALGPVLHTPLGPLADGLTLAEVGTANRLCELDFELPLLGGDAPLGKLYLGELADVLRSGLSAADPVAPWVDRLAHADLADQSLVGYLTGSIDVVLRVGGGRDARYLVVDYKTNRLHPAGTEPRLWHYRDEAMARAMHDADYPLQALLYQIALHRYLTWRHPGYVPERNLGGSLYLFLRGMAGPDMPRDDGIPGVFQWRPPAAVVVACSTLLARGVR
ncbi:MAG: UvrD-helicase domain-containing protein [Sporichthyaceae bacterium]